MTTVPKQEFSYLQRTPKLEGLVCLGCGSDLHEWVDGVIGILEKEEIATKNDFKQPYSLETSGGRIDLVFEFAIDNQINIERLAIWRIRFGDCSWISDYVVNYACHHEIN
ncbi:hypothetical protein Klosneuvirus_1_134 [Klosneuvirus KNV1]|uniref:Uncharacterized protein n=1 Tax=Klosneuvirus KNV1 TaxID=1977640 RepID=A0A1V0SHT6_9VIRU|nr:hypothetical protein Klosneuvirus_1_134 [Klosneuvirus KNV1]